MSFNEEFDTFGNLQFRIKGSSTNDLSYFNAIDKKTETRISQDSTKNLQSIASSWTVYTFK
jgi:hypothetical protein